MPENDYVIKCLYAPGSAKDRQSQVEIVTSQAQEDECRARGFVEYEFIPDTIVESKYPMVMYQIRSITALDANDEQLARQSHFVEWPSFAPPADDAEQAAAKIAARRP